MYLHIGNDVCLSDEWLVAVLDLDRATESCESFRNYLVQCEKEGHLQWLGPEIPRSVVICLDQVYLTPVRAETLRERYFEARSGQSAALGMENKGDEA